MLNLSRNLLGRLMALRPQVARGGLRAVRPGPQGMMDPAKWLRRVRGRQCLALRWASEASETGLKPPLPRPRMRTYVVPVVLLSLTAPACSLFTGTEDPNMQVGIQNSALEEVRVVVDPAGGDEVTFSVPADRFSTRGVYVDPASATVTVTATGSGTGAMGSVSCAVESFLINSATGDAGQVNVINGAGSTLALTCESPGLTPLP